MGDTSPANPILIESRGGAVIAKAQVKMMDDDALKTLTRLTDEAAAVNPETSLVIVDLSRVSILPSLALGLLVQMAAKCKAREQKLKLVGVQPSVRQVFAITRLDRVFQFVDSVDAALE